MSYLQVISAILTFVICSNAVVKATGNVNFHNNSRQHEGSSRHVLMHVYPHHHVNEEDSYRGVLPDVGKPGKRVLKSKDRVIPENRDHSSPVGMQVPGPLNVHQTNFTPGAFKSRKVKRSTKNVNSKQVPRPYVYESFSWTGCINRIPEYVTTLSDGISTMKTAVRTNGTISHLDLEKVLQMEDLLKCIRTLLNGISTIRTASRIKGTFSNVDIEDIFTLKDILKLDDLFKCGKQVPGTLNVRQTNLGSEPTESSYVLNTTEYDSGDYTFDDDDNGANYDGVEDLSVDTKDEDFSAPDEEPNALPPLACQCDCANSELRDVDNGGNGNRDIGALAANMG